jgi:hypothetical protein
MAFLGFIPRKNYGALAGKKPFGATRGKIFALMFLAILCCPFARAETASPEYKLKAVFLFNFVRFVEWPPRAFATSNSPVIIGVLGTDPFGKTLDQTVKGEIVNGHPVEVRRYKTVNEIKQCHVLFISASESARLSSIFDALKGRSILTVGDVNGFADKGGMVRFRKENNKIRFRINIEAAKAEDLSISSKLLQLADIVPEKNP